MKHLILRVLGVILCIFLLCFAVTPSKAAAAIIVDIVGPSSGRNLLPDTQYTFLVKVTQNNYDIYLDESFPNTTLSVSIEGGSFMGAAGTRNDHFSIQPQAGDSPAVYKSTTVFDCDTSKVAMVTLKTDASGTLRIKALAQVDGTYHSILAYSGSGEAVPFEAAIQDLGSSENPESQFLDFLTARYITTQSYIQMKTNRMNSASGTLYGEGITQEGLTTDCANLTHCDSNITRMISQWDFLTTPAEGALGYDETNVLILSFIDPFSARQGFTENLMDIAVGATTMLTHGRRTAILPRQILGFSVSLRPLKNRNNSWIASFTLQGASWITLKRTLLLPRPCSLL